MVGIEADANHLAAPKGVEEPVRADFSLDTAVATPLTLIADQRDDVVAAIPELVLEPEVLPRRQPGSPKPLRTLSASVDTGQVRDHASEARRIPFDLRRHEGFHRLDVASNERLKQDSDDRHVLLRHRLLRESGGFEGSVPRSLEIHADYFASSSDIARAVSRLAGVAVNLTARKRVLRRSGPELPTGGETMNGRHMRILGAVGSIVALGAVALIALPASGSAPAGPRLFREAERRARDSRR